MFLSFLNAACSSNIGAFSLSNNTNIKTLRARSRRHCCALYSCCNLLNLLFLFGILIITDFVRSASSFPSTPRCTSCASLTSVCLPPAYCHILTKFCHSFQLAQYYCRLQQLGSNSRRSGVSATLPSRSNQTDDVSRKWSVR